MPDAVALPPRFLKPLADAIGDALTTEALETIVKAATGNGLYEEYCAPGDPRRLCVRKTLERLGAGNQHHWLLIAVMIALVDNASLRELIVKGCPAVLTALPGMDGQVERALRAVAWLEPLLRAPADRLAIRQSRAKITEVCEKIARLAAYKNLHEALHGLDLKMSFQPDTDWRALLAATIQAVRAEAARLGPAGAAEEAWIAALEQSTGAYAAAVAAADPAAADRLAEIRRLVRLQLARLNTAIFEAASALTLGDLVAILPPWLAAEEGFEELVFSVYDLKTAVLARALVHKVWQDAENALSLIEAVLAIQSSSAEAVENWFLLQRRLLWLASLDPNAEWSEHVRRVADDVVDGLAQHGVTFAPGPELADLRRLVKFQFFAIDAALKTDCGSLGKLRVPLANLAAEAVHA